MTDEQNAAKKRGRAPGFRMSDEHRTKIAKSQILKRLVDHVEGKVEMSATQVTAGLGLIRKFLPDLQAVELSGDEESPVQVVSTIRREIVRHSND